MTIKIDLRNELTYDEWRALTPIQRTFAIGDLGEIMFKEFLKRKDHKDVILVDYKTNGYDIQYTDKNNDKICAVEVKTMKPRYKDGPYWKQYYFETGNKDNTKKPEYLINDVDVYTIYDMYEGQFYIFNCKKLRNLLNYITDDEQYMHEYSKKGIVVAANMQGTSYGVYMTKSREDHKDLFGFIGRYEAPKVPKSLMWLYNAALKDAELKLI